MTHESMTIHRALVELKTIDSRISKALENAQFCISARVNTKQLFGQPVEEFLKQAVSDYDSVWDLINRRNAIKAAIPVSNALTNVKVGDEEMTVAEAIAFKQNGIQMYQKLLDVLNDQYADAITEIEQNNGTLERRADSHVASIYGNSATAKAADPDDVQRARETYINANTYELIDGLKGCKKDASIESIIKEMQTYIDTFQNELDAALSVSNATTTIEFDY